MAAIEMIVIARNDMQNRIITENNKNEESKVAKKNKKNGESKEENNANKENKENKNSRAVSGNMQTEKWRKRRSRLVDAFRVHLLHKAFDEIDLLDNYLMPM